MKNLAKIFLLFSTIFSITIDGYLRQSEFTICMDDCSQYYIYQEGGLPEEYVIFPDNFSQIDLYLNRYVSITSTNEYLCIECSALEVENISISDDCSIPVDCFVDPCSVSLPCDGNAAVECISNYCGDCYADFYDSNNNLVDCNTSYCDDLESIDFGMCDMVLGIGISNGECQYISGCDWVVDGIDYSDLLFNNIEDCENTCFEILPSCEDLESVDFGDCAMVLGVGISNGECQYISGCGLVVDGIDYSDLLFNNIEDCENTCFEILPSCEDIEYDYEQLHYDEFAECNYDNDCNIVLGACYVGLGGCYYAINEDIYLEEEVNFLVDLWLNNDCMQWVCDCMPMPYPICNSNTCEAAYCNSPNPAGCIQTGCSEGYECVQSSDNCSASWCSCEDVGSFYGEWYCTEDCNGGECLPIESNGDVNVDGIVNVLDVVAIINIILNLEDYNLLADINQDEIINVLDIILVIDIILNN